MCIFWSEPTHPATCFCGSLGTSDLTVWSLGSEQPRNAVISKLYFWLSYELQRAETQTPDRIGLGHLFCFCFSIASYEQLSKLLVSPLVTPIVVPYIIPYITPFKEFRLWLIYRFEKVRCARRRKVTKMESTEAPTMMEEWEKAPSGGFSGACKACLVLSIVFSLSVCDILELRMPDGGPPVASADS